MQTFYSNLTSPYNDVFAVPYPYEIKDDEAQRKAEEHMKALVNDFDKMVDMGLTAVCVRLKNSKTGQATNRTFFVSQRDQQGTHTSTTPKRVHRFNEHGKLLSVGVRTYKKRESPKPARYTFEFWEESKPFSATGSATLKPRQEEAIKIAKDESRFHPECSPFDGQARLTFSYTNDYARSLVKRDLLDNATAYLNKPDGLKSIVRHGFDETYEGKVLRIIAQGEGDCVVIHYFKCVIAGKSNKFHVELEEGNVLKNWAPAKHVPMVKAFLNIE